MDDEKERHWTAERWTISAVHILPIGYINQYGEDDGGIWEEPCPAILTQELRETDHCSSTKNCPISVEREYHKPPFETRAVFAAPSDWGGLDPVCEASNYKQTILKACPPALASAPQEGERTP